jgi:formate hydrogenlyase subunit 6/NADH:ubiquinone oxidoreductase subunit I
MTTSALARIAGTPKVYQIDYGRCILCGFCVDACPTDAINHGHNFEWAVYTPGELVKDKQYLLANKWREPDVTPNANQRHLAKIAASR